MGALLLGAYEKDNRLRECLVVLKPSCLKPEPPITVEVH